MCGSRSYYWCGRLSGSRSYYWCRCLSGSRSERGSGGMGGYRSRRCCVMMCADTNTDANTNADGYDA